MSIQYLTADHQYPPALIERNGMLIPRGIYESYLDEYDPVAHTTRSWLINLNVTVRHTI